MNVNIITVYQSANYGSYLQAKALYELIIDKYPVYLVDTPARSLLKNAFVPLIKSAINEILHGHLTVGLFHLKRIMARACSMKSVKQNKLSEANGCFIFGSDEIWNVSRKEMQDYPFLWGKGIEGNKKISYAPSINNSDEKQLIDNGLKEELDDFAFISARDEYSCKVLKKVTGREVVKVLDPTMLLTKDYYLSRANYKKIDNYIAVYLFNPSDKEIEIIKYIAKKLQKKLVSIGRWYSWCDKCITGINPFDYYINADFVIANTFHGTAFAINLEKQFVSFARSKKIKELLSDYMLESQNVDELSKEEIDDLIFQVIDYANVRVKLEKDRQFSKDFLYSRLAEIVERDM